MIVPRELWRASGLLNVGSAVVTFEPTRLARMEVRHETTFSDNSAACCRVRHFSGLRVVLKKSLLGEALCGFSKRSRI